MHPVFPAKNIVELTTSLAYSLRCPTQSVKWLFLDSEHREEVIKSTVNYFFPVNTILG